MMLPKLEWSVDYLNGRVSWSLHVDNRIDEVTPISDIWNRKHNIVLRQIQHDSRVQGIDIWFDDAWVVRRSKVALVNDLVHGSIP